MMAVMKRSIFDLRPATKQAEDDLGAFVQMFGVARMMNPRNREVTQLAIAQFVAIRACLRMPLP
jgi:hypothetical protein